MTSMLTPTSSARVPAGDAADPYVEYLAELTAHGLLIPSGVPGVYGRSGVFERVIEQFDAYITRVGGYDGADVMRFPSIIPRAHFERSGYLKSFPHLAGSVHSFCGDEHGHADLLRALDRGEDWAKALSSTDVVLTPAACYSVYPTMSDEQLPDEGRLFDVLGTCYRHEPSNDPARMQMFRQREYVRVGTPEAVRAHRDLWLERGQEMLRAMQLPVHADVANDPFFGRAGRMLAINQRDQALKFELLVPICSEEKPTALVSCNYHQDHFGHAYDITLADGSPAHTACVGFGLERIALALFRWHGFDVERWPLGVRRTLEL
jgi:seryl-tRNA synthetase